MLNISAQEESPAKKEGSPTKKEESPTKTEGSPNKKEGSVTPEPASRSKFFPRIEARPFEPETLARDFFPMTGPNEERVNNLLKETGYNLIVTPHQRLYKHVGHVGHDGHDGHDRPPPGPGCQVFVGRIPKQLFEDTLVPIFAAYGTIWSMRLMMEGSTALSRGYGFVVYTEPEEARNAQKMVSV